MDTTQQDEPPLSSPESSRGSTSFNIQSTHYLTVPITGPTSSYLTLPRPLSSEEEHPDWLQSSLLPRSASVPIPRIREPSPSNVPSEQDISSSFSPQLSDRTFMSVYSSTSAESEHSVYSNPPARVYRVPSFQNMSASRRISTAEKDQMIQALRSHRVNTIFELRRIERAFAVLGSPDVTEPMTTAWSYYVNSHGLLTELRGLTKNYPFSTDCLEEAKRRVYSDPQSNRSWNFCWLVLSKIQSDQLIPYYAQYQAAQPAMWGGKTPTPEGISQLSNAFIAEWNYALRHMLRNWDQPPTR